MVVGIALAVQLSLGGIGDLRPRAWLTSTVLAQADTDVIELNDGRAVVGTIVDEVKQGYLLRNAKGETSLIEYSKVKSVRRAQGATPAPARAPAAPSARDRDNELLDAVERELASLRADLAKVPIGGGIVAVVLGGVFFAASLITFFATFFNYGSAVVGLFIASICVMIASAAVLVVGIVILAANGGKRQKLKLRIESLEERRERLFRSSREPGRSPADPGVFPQLAWRF